MANSFWRRGRKKAIVEQRTASSSPEHPLFRGHGRSLLGGCRHAFREYDNDINSSRSLVFNTLVWLVNKQDLSIHNPEACICSLLASHSYTNHAFQVSIRKLFRISGYMYMTGIKLYW